MKATRIKWDESMAARCLERLNEYYPKPKKAAAVYSIAKAKDIKKDAEWDDFKKAVNKAM